LPALELVYEATVDKQNKFIPLEQCNADRQDKVDPGMFYENGVLIQDLFEVVPDWGLKRVTRYELWQYKEENKNDPDSAAHQFANYDELAFSMLPINWLQLIISLQVLAKFLSPYRIF